MGTIDLALCCYTSTMVPVYFLLVALPFAAGGLPNMEQMNNLMNMMRMMEAAKEVQPWQAPVAPAPQAPVLKMQTKEEYEAYLKWCAENQARDAEQAKQQELLDAWKAREEARKAEAEKMRVAAEAEEKRKNQMAQYKMWERQMEMSATFDSISREVTEVKAKWYHTVTFEFLRFCKCSEFTVDIGHYFNKEEFYKNEEFDIEDLGLSAVKSQNVDTVANALFQMSQGDRTKAFFGGLATAMCGGARDYMEQVEEWEKSRNFLDNLS